MHDRHRAVERHDKRWREREFVEEVRIGRREVERNGSVAIVGDDATREIASASDNAPVGAEDLRVEWGEAGMVDLKEALE
jgi:hypothetical protein